MMVIEAGLKSTIFHTSEIGISRVMGPLPLNLIKNIQSYKEVEANLISGQKTQGESSIARSWLHMASLQSSICIFL